MAVKESKTFGWFRKALRLEPRAADSIHRLLDSIRVIGGGPYQMLCFKNTAGMVIRQKRGADEFRIRGYDGLIV